MLVVDENMVVDNEQSFLELLMNEHLVKSSLVAVFSVP